MSWMRRGVRTVEQGQWHALWLIAGGGAAVGIAAALAGLYPVAFVVLFIPLSVVAFASATASCVLVGLTCPIVAVGSLDLGFHWLPSYLMVVAGLAGIVYRREWRAFQPVIADYWLLAFGGVAVAVSLANLGSVPHTTVIGAVGANGRQLRSVAQVAALLLMIGLYLLVRVGVRDQRHVAAVLRALLVAATLVGAYAVYQWVARRAGLPYGFLNERRPGSVLLPPDAGRFRPNSTLTEASPLAQFMILPTLVSLALLFRRTPPEWFPRRAIAAIALGGMAVVVLTFSKSAFLVLSLLLPVLAALSLSAVRRRRYLWVGVPVLIAVLVVGLFALRFTVIQSSAPTSLNNERYVRVGYWIAAARTTADHPAGVGVGNFPFYYPIYAPPSFDYQYEAGIADGHNVFLEAAADTGIVGALLLLGFAVSVTAGALVRALRGPPGWLAAATLGVSLAAIGGLLMHLTYGYFYFPFEWLALGLAATLPVTLDRAGGAVGGSAQPASGPDERDLDRALAGTG